MTTTLPIRTKLAYGVGDLGPAIVATISGFFLNAFLIEVAGIPPAMAAAIFFIVKIWDAFNDPLIGTLTDRTRSRWGRRRPWLLFGALPFGVAFFLHWLVPDLSLTGKFVYYLLVALALDTGFTAVNVPYASLTPELTDDYDERTNLNAYRFIFSVLGGAVAAAVHSTIVSAYAGPAIAQGYAISAAIWAVVIVVSNIITFLFTTENYVPPVDEPSPGYIDSLRIVFANRPFIYVTLIYLLSWLAVQFVQNNLFLYVKYWSRAEEQFTALLITLQLFIVVSLPLWSRLNKRIGKQNVFYAGAIVWIIASIALYFIPQGNVTPLYFIAPIAAFGVGVCYLIPWSMLPDVIDLDELETGVRREGIYYGFYVFLQKLGISLGLAASNLILGAAGYIRPDYDGGLLAPAQPEAVLNALRIFVSLSPAAILLIGIFVVYRYPITRARHAELQETLRRRQNSAL